MALPGDPFIPPTTVVSTRAITIHAPVAQVWPWIVQLGQQHAGFYSYDWLENLFAARMHNADQIVPEWQETKVGDPVFMMANPPPMSVAEIVLLEPEQMLVLKGGWAFYLQPLDAQTTRFIVRYASFCDYLDQLAHKRSARGKAGLPGGGRCVIVVGFAGHLDGAARC